MLEFLLAYFSPTPRYLYAPWSCFLRQTISLYRQSGSSNLFMRVVEPKLRFVTASVYTLPATTDLAESLVQCF